MAAGSETCWCFEAAIPAEVLDRLPEAARGKTCVCEKCASGGAKARAAFAIVR
jgi:hypothetical protein